MKKVLLVAVFAVFGMMSSQAQGFKAGVNLGFPFGSVGENFSFQAGIDIAYTFEISESFSLGATTGYGRFFGKDIDIPDYDAINGQRINKTIDGPSFGFVPIAATLKYAFGNDQNFFVGGDIGYAIAVGDDAVKDLAGLLFEPKVGWQNDMIEIFGFYRGIGSSETKSESSGNVTVSTTSASLASAGIGAAYKF